MPVELFLEAHRPAPERIVLDLDATDDPLHGRQEGRFFHGYHDGYCYLPPYVFCGSHLLLAKLRRANIDASAGAVEDVARIIAQIRTRWPRVEIVLRADSGFARDALMAWCADHRVDYVFGLARKSAWSAPSRITSPPPRRRAWRAAARLAALPTSPGARRTAGAGSGAWSPRPSTCLEDPRAPERTQHTLTEMIRFRALLIAAGYEDANDCDGLRTDPAFKMAVGRLPENGADLCSQPAISRLENLPGPVALKRMMAAMVELF